MSTTMYLKPKVAAEPLYNPKIMQSFVATPWGASRGSAT